MFLKDIKIDKEKIKTHIDKLASINAIPGKGTNRLAYTVYEREAHKYITKQMEQLGFNISVDSFGNTIGILSSENTKKAPILTGSHIDTVINGGNYDGLVGVVGGLEALRSIILSGYKPKHKLGLIIFAGEEGSSNFGTGRIGSQLKTGLLKFDEIKDIKNNEGVSLKDAMDKLGFRPEVDSIDIWKKGDITAFLEMHIEQSFVLEKNDIQVGIINGIASYTRFIVEIIGQADHSGATPMKYRKDALFAAAEMIVDLHWIADNIGGTYNVVNVGWIHAYPGSITIVPGKVEFYLETRDIDFKSKKRVRDNIISRFKNIAKKHNVKINLQLVTDQKPTTISKWMQNLGIKACKDINIPYMVMPSGASHDAASMATCCPVGMVFVPSHKGISHSALEYTKLEDIISGTKVLANYIINLDNKIK